MTRYHRKSSKTIVGGVRVPFTAEEETQRDADEAQAVIDAQTREDAEAAAAVNKASAEKKLRDLGLTDAEISAFRGNN